ncbi:hypothetical protein MSAN_02448100 [Mycena sanguinolenta]|uniref:Uncharacterized protein n=1 Tax=Mycena sanguinolenta TaxID=230812 RepID=A0A8H7CAY8_9AGAR|nr:hypothetical protein MSAN_02448100 [Mycena sanguinolenta]
MPRQGTAKRRREREGGAPVKPGKKPWVHGTKVAFFQGYKDDFLAAVEMKTTGAFYDRIGQLYLGKYGYHTAWDADLPQGKDVADDVDANEDVDSLPADETAAREKYFKKVRGKIAVWYNAQYRGGVQRKEKAKTFKQLFDKTELEPPAPVKPRVLHFYSRRFYDERIKSRVETRWAAVSRLPNPPALVTVRNLVTKEAWESETEAFRAEVVAALEKEHANALEAYKMALAKETPTTAEEFDVALNNAAFYLQPFAEAAEAHYGMNVAILMCGPIPDRGGRIECRSVLAGFSNGLVPRIWSDFDRAGFDAAQSSFIAFSRHCFTEQQCRDRALNQGSAPSNESLPPPSESLAPPLGASPPSSESPLPPLPESLTPAMRASSPSSEAAPSPATNPPLALQPPVEPQQQPPPLGNAPPPADDMGVPSWFSLQGEGVMPSALAGDGDGATRFWPFGSMSDEEWDEFLHRPGGGFEGLAWSGPVIGKALGDEIAAMEAGQGLEYMGSLGKMSADEVEQENARAEARAAESARNAAGDQAPPPRATPTPPTVGQTPTAQTPPRASETPTAQTPPRASETPTPRPQPKPAWRGAQARPAADNPDGAPDTPGAANANGDTEGGTNRAAPAERKGGAGDGGGSEKEVENGEDDGGTEAEQEERERERGVQEGGGANEEEQQSNGSGAATRVWDPEDEEKWPAELRMAYGAFTRAKEWGGKEWAVCVDNLITLERRWGFREKGRLSMPAGTAWPEEIPDFMRRARKWDKQMPLTSAPGPASAEGSFAERWWTWWSGAQPEGRRAENGKLTPAVLLLESEFEELSKMSGRNGLLLCVGALLWWGEAALDQEGSTELLKDWKIAVEDVGAVLAKAALAVKIPMEEQAKKSRSGTRAPTTGTKRSRPASEEGKENEEPQKRRRRSKS